MTTLIIDFNTKAVYADSRTTQSQDGNETIRFDDNALKLFNIEGKVLAGVGCAEVLSKVMDNLLSNNFNFIQKTKRKATIYVVSKKGDILEVEKYRTNKRSWLTGYYSWERIYERLTLKDGWITAGSGGDYAAGALKLFNIEGKVLAGVGCAEVLSKVRDNLSLSNNFNFIPKTKRKATIYIVSKKGDILEVEEYATKKRSWLTGYFSWSRVYKQLSTKDSWITDGSGREFAAGALKQGATPEEAINVASMLDEYTNNVVQKIEL